MAAPWQQETLQTLQWVEPGKGSCVFLVAANFYIDVHSQYLEKVPAYFVVSEALLTLSHFMIVYTWSLYLKDYLPTKCFDVFNKNSLKFVNIEKISKLKTSHVYILQICRLAAACGGIKPAVCLGQTPVMQHSAACSRHSGLQRCTALRERLGWPGHSRVMQQSAALQDMSPCLLSTCHSHQPQTHRSCVRRSKFCCLMIFF